jgi:hypothetical protein
LAKGVFTGLRLESRYYLALSEYSTFTWAGFVTAMDEAKRLHTVLLAGDAPPTVDAQRYKELRILAQCLEVDAMVRSLLDSIDDSTVDGKLISIESRLGKFTREVLPKIWMLAGRSRDPIHAAILRSIGLLKRYSGKEGGALLSMEAVQDEELTEFECFYRALTLERTADTCFCLAETLFSSGRLNEARAFLDETFRLCPKHPGALRLREQLL